MILEYNRVIQTQTSIDAFNTYTRSNHCKGELQMANLSIPRTSGIYKITCTANNKVYIGSAVNLRKRHSAHFSGLEKRRHFNQYLQNAYNKYGAISFIFDIIEYVPISNLRDREQYWLDEIKPYDHSIGFNISLDAIAPTRGRVMGPMSVEAVAKSASSRKGQKRSPEQCERIGLAKLGKKNTPEQNKKISDALIGKPKKPEAIAKTRNFHKGRKRSPETVERLRIAKTGFKHSNESRVKMSLGQKGKTVSEETRSKISASHMGLTSKPESIAKRIINLGNRYEVFSPNGQMFEIVNLNQFCKDNGLSQSRMSAVSLGKQDNHRGWKVRRVN